MLTAVAGLILSVQLLAHGGKLDDRVLYSQVDNILSLNVANCIRRCDLQ